MFSSFIRFSDNEWRDLGFRDSKEDARENEYIEVSANAGHVLPRDCLPSALLHCSGHGLKLTLHWIRLAAPDIARQLLSGYVVKFAILLLLFDATGSRSTYDAVSDQGGAFLGFLISDLLLTGTLRLVSRKHLADLWAAERSGDYRAMTLKFRELNTTLLATVFPLGLLLYFIPGPALELVGVETGTSSVAVLFCRVAVAAVIPRAAVLVLSEAVLTPQLEAVPVAVLSMYSMFCLLVILLLRIATGGMSLLWSAVAYVCTDVVLAVVRASCC